MNPQNNVMETVKTDNGSGDNCSVISDKTNLIVNYLPQSTVVHDLIMLFRTAGNLESVRIMRHPRTGYSYGYGFVKYTTEEAASKAIQLFNKLPYRNKVLKVSYSRPSYQVTKNANLYISNLPKLFSDEQLVELFGQHGEIIQYRLLFDKITGMPRGIAFLRYAREEYAQKAINHLNGVKLAGCQYALRVRIADDYSQLRANTFFNMGLYDQRGFCMNQPMNRPFPQIPMRNTSPPPHFPRFHGGGAGNGGGGGDMPYFPHNPHHLKGWW